MKKNIYNVCIGLVIGAFFPFTLALMLYVAYGIVISIALRYFHADFRLNDVELFILLMLLVIMSFFFLVRFNRIVAAAALITAAGVMILLLSIITYP